MSHLSYAGIGSRETPAEVLSLMTKLGGYLAMTGYTLRSGAAPGADTAFETGARAEQGACEIYLPWRNFNGHASPRWHPRLEAFQLAAQFHPNWAACSDGARKLHARNCHQILGDDLQSPVLFVLCWTPGGKGGGGTGQALRIARHYDIPVDDLADPQVRAEAESLFIPVQRES